MVLNELSTLQNIFYYRTLLISTYHESFRKWVPTHVLGIVNHRATNVGNTSKGARSDALTGDLTKLH